MTHERKTRSRAEGLAFGVILVLAGGVFLLDRLDVLEVGRLWGWWPLIPVTMGLVRISSWQSAESVASGLGWALFGAWFLVSQRGWFGLDWHNSWPMVLVAIGLSMVTRALLEPWFRRRAKESDPQGGGTHA